ncbi:MAG: glycosyltransferase [Thermodesulfobacteriota bacterium]
MFFRTKVLTILNKLFPVPEYGDAVIDNDVKYKISCIINFYGRTELLRNILYCLKEQDFDEKSFEVLLVEDRNGTREGKKIADDFSKDLNVKYITLKDNFGIMGYSRNLGICESEGKYILFLDDDTIILQSNFLSRLYELFEQKKPDGIMPKGYASFCITKNKYQFHDPFYPTNRCMAYSRKTLMELKGFKSKIIGQEDVEFTLRLYTGKRQLIRESHLIYFHPPLIQHNYTKSASVGLSYYNLKNEYPFIIWVLLLINGCRYLPLGLLPINEKYRNQFKFSKGFFLGIIYGIKGKTADYK